MSGDPVVFEERGCPVCRKDIMSFESEEGGFADGEPCFCAGNCGWNGHVSIGGDGEAWPLTAERSEWKERAEKAEAQRDCAMLDLRAERERGVDRATAQGAEYNQMMAERNAARAEADAWKEIAKANGWVMK